MRRLVSSAFLLAAGLHAQTLTPYRVADLNTQTDGVGSIPTPVVSIGGKGVFLVGDEGELWSSDGTAAGTVLLARGPQFNQSGAPAARIAYLGEAISPGVFRFWATDGTPAGTVPISPTLRRLARPLHNVFLILPGSDRLYFAGRDALGTELWTANGTPGGTRRIVDLTSGAGDSEPHELTSFRGRIYFAADDGRGVSLWSTNGSAGGTRLVLDPDRQNRQLTGPTALTVVGQTLFFFSQSSNGWYLWKSDGTTHGTVQVKRIAARPPRPDFVPQTLFHLGRLYFAADDGSHGEQLWASDGTAAGTARITELGGPRTFPLSLPQVQLPGRLVFIGNDDEPWVSNGRPGGSQRLKDICPGPCPGVIDGPKFAFGNRLYFPAGTPARGTELWSTDGTPAGTRLFKDFCRGDCSSEPRLFGSVAGGFYFAAATLQGDQIWRSNGTPGGTVKLTNFTYPVDGFSLQGVIAGQSFLFNGHDDMHGRELWKTEGTRASTALLADFAPNRPASSMPRSFARAGSHVTFLADDGVHTPGGLWSSDGTAAGTIRLLDSVASPFRPTSADHFAYFLRGVNFDYTLWRTDATAQGTFQISPPGLSFPHDFVTVGDRAYFIATDAAHGEELWVTDGTAASTHIVADTLAGPASSGVSNLQPAFSGRLVFRAYDGTSNYSFVTDGTAAGTRRFEDAYPFIGEFGGDFAGGKSYFRREVADGQLELWASDGTAAGTIRLFDSSVYVADLTVVGDRVLFAVSIDATYLGLYASDGTPAGTRLLHSDLVLEDRFQPAALGQGIVFLARHQGGHEHRSLWVTDGTAAGTRLLVDPPDDFDRFPSVTPFADRLLLSGRSNLWLTDGTPEGTTVALTFPIDEVPFLTTAGDRAFYSRYSEEIGTELWALRVE